MSRWDSKPNRETMIRFVLPLLLLGAPPVSACAVEPVEHPAAPSDRAGWAVDEERLLADIWTLAADSMKGRRAGTEGGARARSFLLSRFRELGLRDFGEGYEQEFVLSRGGADAAPGVNLVGYVRGSEHPDRYVVVTAHYDHLGMQNGMIYNGADDNASGTAALLALAAHLRVNTPRHSIVFVATDAEEGSVHGGEGLQGARAFVRDPPIPLERIVLNVNLDMISRSERDELYAAGTYHHPELTPLVERVAATAPLRLLMGHDRPGLPPGDDWTMSSDHGAFHEAGIPFLYFGVEDHEDYHRPTDVFENIDPDFYVRAVRTVGAFLNEVDRSLDGRRRGEAVAPLAPALESGG
jgi:hypothetical protein